MAELCNHTVINPNTLSHFRSGLVAYGVSTDDTIFDGPGLMRFECKNPIKGITVGNVIWTLAEILIVIFIAVMSHHIGKHDGKLEAAERLAWCRNEQERKIYVNDVFKTTGNSKEREQAHPWSKFETWPGETEVDSVVAKRLALCRDERERSEYVEGLVKAHGKEAEADTEEVDGSLTKLAERPLIKHAGWPLPKSTERPLMTKE